jgi:hypothetical protein
VTDTARCPTCGWDGDDPVAAIALLREENVELRKRAEKAEVALAKLYEYTKRVEAQYAPMLASRSYLPGFPDGAEQLGDEVRAALATVPLRAAGEGE